MIYNIIKGGKQNGLQQNNDRLEKYRNHCLNNPQKCGWVKFERREKND